MSETVFPTSTARQPNVGPIDPELLKIFGPPPLYPGESEEDYNQLHDHVRRAVRPVGAVEEMWVRDIGDLFWATLRFRRLKAKLMAVAFADQLRNPGLIVGGAILTKAKPGLLNDYALGKPASIREIDSLLEGFNIDRAVIEARAFAGRLTDFERIDQLITQAEKRRNAALRELDRHREAVAKRLRDVLAEIEHAEFEDAPVTEGEAQP
jgi:hypothetical protein